MGSDFICLSSQTAGIILAAGMSKRLGQPKQLLRFREKYLLEYVLDAALASSLDTVILVLGYQSRKITETFGAKLIHPRLRVVVNVRYPEGLSSTLRVGLHEARRFASVMFLLGDQPRVDAKLIDLLLDRFSKSEKDICVPSHRGRRGNPALFGSRFYDTLMKIEGDVGAREVIASHPDQVLEVEVDDPDVFTDIDTHADLEAMGGITF